MQRDKKDTFNAYVALAPRKPYHNKILIQQYQTLTNQTRIYYPSTCSFVEKLRSKASSKSYSERKGKFQLIMHDFEYGAETPTVENVIPSPVVK